MVEQKTSMMIESARRKFLGLLAIGTALFCLQTIAPGYQAKTAYAQDDTWTVFQGSGVELLLAGHSPDEKTGAGSQDKGPVKGVQDDSQASDPNKTPDSTSNASSAKQAPPKTAPEADAKKKSETAATPSTEGRGSVASTDPADLVKQAKALAKKGEHASALEKYVPAVEAASKGGNKKLAAMALHGAAEASYRLGKAKEALDYIKRSIAVNRAIKDARNRSLDYFLAGRILMVLSKYSLALTSFEEARKILPASEADILPELLEEKSTCLVRLGRYPQALRTLNQALAIYVKKGADIQAARLHLSIGEIHVSRSDYRSANTHFVKAEQLYRKHHRTVELGETLFRIAYLRQVLGNFKGAEKAMAEGQSLLADKGSTSIAALPLLVKGMNAYREGRVIQAVKDLSKALHAYEKSGDRIMEARVRLALANVQLHRSRLEAALVLAGKGLSQFRSQSSAGGEAAALLVIAQVYSRQGFVQKAREYTEAALALSRKVHDRNGMVQGCVLMADLHETLGDTEAALKQLKEAIDIARSGVNQRTRGLLALAVARYRLSREALEKALHAAGNARKHFVEINDRRHMADCDHLMGVVHEVLGDRQKAKSLLDRALKEHRVLWDRYGEGRDLTALGVHYKNRGEPDKALEYFRMALDLRKGIGDLGGYAANLVNVGNLLRHRNEIPEAQKSLRKALAVYRELSDRKGEADVLTNLGHVDAALGMLASALEKFEAALATHREIQDKRGMATDLASIGKVHLSRGDLEKAAAHLQEARKINKESRDPRGEIAILADLAMLKRAERNPAAALSLLTKAREQAVKLNDNAALSSINLKMSAVYEDTGKYEKALKLLRMNLADARRRGDRKGELWALGGVGIIQVKLEDYEAALKNLHKAQRLRTELGLPASQSRDLDFYLGEIYDGFRDYERALEHYHTALSLYQVPGNDGILAQIYERIGDIYYRLEEYAKAQSFFEDALRMSTETRDLQMQKRHLIRLGDIAGKLGKTEGALKYQQRALAVTREEGDRRTEARILTRIGTLYQILGRPRTALENYQEARDIRKSLGDLRGMNENLLQIALVTSRFGNFDAAVADLKRAFEIAQCSEDRSLLWKAYFIMGRTLEGKRSLGEALESYRKAISVVEAMEADTVEEFDEDEFIFGGKTALFETSLRVLMKLARRDPEGAYDNLALKIVEKLKAAEFENTLSRINVESFSDLPRDLLIKEKSLKLSLRRLNSRLAEERSKVNSSQHQIQKLLEERRAKEQSFVKLKQRLKKEYPSYADLRYPRPVSVHRLQRDVIGQNEAILEYMVTRSRTYLFVIDKRRFHTFSIDYASKDLERDVDAVTRPLYNADTLASWDPSVAYRLYSRIIKPIEYSLVGKKTVMIIPHGPLSALPFEILVDSKSHAGKRFWSAKDKPTYLVEKYAFCYAPSAAVLSHIRTRKRDRKPGWNLVAFGDAVYVADEKTGDRNPGADRLMTAIGTTTANSRGPHLRPLPGTRKEILEIVKIMGGPTQTYFGKQASETLFKKADLGRYNYLHLATHGVLLSGAGKFQQQPAIIFSLYGDKKNDGFLQLGEVFGLKLNSDLVVLSSCLSPGKMHPSETNGLMGLSRAFLFAGTDAIVLSMWQVNDESTAKLFLRMYRNLEQGSKAEALRRAKLTLLKDSATNHPYYWAPFVLVGNWHTKLPPSINKVNPEQIRFKGLSTWRKWLSM